MKPTQILTDEHRVIEQVIGCLEKMCELADAEGRLDGERAGLAIEFIQHFADHCHHMKEEDQLFKMLVDRGFTPEQGPVAVMLAEHEQGRGYVREMEQTKAAAAEGAKEALTRFSFAARSYAELLRSHIIKEDFILYPMADDAFSEEDQQQLLRQFDEAEAGHAGHHEHFLKVATELGEYYGVERPTEPDQAGLASVCLAHADMPGMF